MIRNPVELGSNRIAPGFQLQSLGSSLRSCQVRWALAMMICLIHLPKPIGAARLAGTECLAGRKQDFLIRVWPETYEVESLAPARVAGCRHLTQHAIRNTRLESCQKFDRARRAPPRRFAD